MTTILRRSLLPAALPLALLLAAPAAARAACEITSGDWDGNGRPDIRVFGSTYPDNLTVNAGPNQTTVALTCMGTSVNKTFSGDFYTYGLYLKGSDVISFNVVGDWVGRHRNLQVQLGAKTNKVTIGGTGRLLGGSSLIVNLDGMVGADTVAIVVPATDGSFLDAHIDLDDNVDQIIVKADKPITGGSVVNINGTLGNHDNSYKVIQTGLIDATLNIDMEGGPYADAGSLTLAGPIGPNGRLFYRSDLGPLNDAFNGIVSLSLFRIAAGGEVRVDVLGGPGDDVLTLSRNGSTGGNGTPNAGLLDVRLNGEANNDAITVDLAGGGFKLDGTTRLRLDGGPNNDTVKALLDVAGASTTPTQDLFLFGGPGSDKLALTINDNGPRTHANYGKAGLAFVDGGLDAADACTVGGNAGALVHKRNCEQ